VTNADHFFFLGEDFMCISPVAVAAAVETDQPIRMCTLILLCSATACRERRGCYLQARRPTRANRSSRSPSRSINSRCCIPPPSFGSRAGVQGPELMMMSAVMAAGRMRRTLMEGPLHGPRGTVPSAAAAQRHQQTSPRRVAGTGRFLFSLVNEPI